MNLIIMEIRYIFACLMLFLCLGVTGQDWDYPEEFIILPSEQTLQNLEDNYSLNEWRAAPPGGGPGLGEIVVPLGHFSLIDGFIICFLYWIYLWFKRSKLLKKHRR